MKLNERLLEYLALVGAGGAALWLAPASAASLAVSTTAGGAGLLGIGLAARRTSKDKNLPDAFSTLVDKIAEDWRSGGNPRFHRFADRDLLNQAQKSLIALLPQCDLGFETLAKHASDTSGKAFPQSATASLLQALSALDGELFRKPEEPIEENKPISRTHVPWIFAQFVISATFKAAIENESFFKAFEPHLLIEMAQTNGDTLAELRQVRLEVGRLRSAFDDVKDSSRGGKSPKAPISNPIVFNHSHNIGFAFVRPASAVQTQALDEQLTLQFDWVLDLDTGESELRIDRNTYLAALADEIARKLQNSSPELTNYDREKLRTRESTNTLGALHDTKFHLGSNETSLEEVFREVSMTESRQDASNPERHKVEHIFDRMPSFDFDGFFNRGVILLQAVLVDLAAIAIERKLAVCLHLQNNFSFPKTVFDPISTTPFDLAQKAWFKIVISGEPMGDEKLAWPQELRQWPTLPPTELIENEEGVGSGRWRMLPGETKYLDAIETISSTSFLDRVICYTLITGLFPDSSDSYWAESVPEITSITQNMKAAFGGYEKPSLRTRRIFLQHLKETDLEAPASPNRQAVMESWRNCLFEFCQTQRVLYLDLILLHCVRGGGTPVDRVLPELNLIASSTRFLSPQGRSRLDECRQILGLVATGHFTHKNVSSALDRITETREDDIPERLLSEAYYQRAYIYFATRKHNNSMGEIELSLVLNEDNYRSMNLAALIEIEEGNLNKALSLISKSIGTFNGYPNAHFNQGVVYEKMDDNVAAANCYISCLLLEPDFYEAIFNLTNVLISLQMYTEAAAVASYGASIAPTFEAELVSNLAVAMLQVGHSKDGIGLLKYVASHNEAPFVCFNLALTYVAQGQFETAKAWLDRIGSQAIDDELAAQIEGLRRVVARNEIRVIEIERVNLQPPHAKHVHIDLLFDYIEVTGLRRDTRIEGMVRSAMLKPTKNPLHYAPTSTKRELTFNRTIVKPKADLGRNKKSKRGKAQNNGDRIKKSTLQDGKFSLDENFKYYRMPSYSGG